MSYIIEAADRLEIREMIENWAIWRDAGMWDRFRTLWHDDGIMMATWFQGGPDEFIANSKASFARGIRAQHVLGGSSIDISGVRAVAQTRMSILHRAPLEYVLCDFTVVGRFYDFFERRDGCWGFVLRQPIYEKDRIDPVVPGTAPKLDAALLARFPEGYRHMAYMQTKAGYQVKADMPGATGAELEALYAKGAAWLDGK
jgi:SnoaL-like protein